MTVAIAEEFATWYSEEFPRVVATLSRAVGHDHMAEEAAAEAFARALVDWRRVRLMESRTGWVYRVALNQVRTTIRRRKLEQRVVARYGAEVMHLPIEPDAEVWAAVARLAPRARMAIELRYLLDLPEREVARLMGIAEGTAAATLHKARARLAAMLGHLRPGHLA